MDDLLRQIGRVVIFRGGNSRAEEEYLRESVDRGDYRKMYRKGYVKQYQLTPKGRRMAVARAARQLQYQEHQDAHDERIREASAKFDEACCGSSGCPHAVWDLPPWLRDDSLPDESLLVKCKTLRVLAQNLRAVADEKLPRVTLREAEVWLMQQKLLGKL